MMGNDLEERGKVVTERGREGARGQAYGRLWKWKRRREGKMKRREGKRNEKRGMQGMSV